MSEEAKARVEIPVWSIPVVASVVVGLGGYIVGQIRTSDEANIRISQAERRIDRIESSVEQVTTVMNNQVVRLAEVAIELKNLNHNLEAK